MLTSAAGQPLVVTALLWSAPCFVLPVLAKLDLEAGRGVGADLGLTGQSTVCSAGQKCKRNRERRFNLLIYLFFFL